jgi:hypothetical protein
VARKTSRAKPKFQLASKDFPVAEPTFVPNTVPGTLPYWHDVGSHAPKPSTLMPFTLGVITMSLTLLVLGFVFAHVPNRAGFGVGGTGLASAGTADDNSAVAAAVVVISAARTARVA